MTTSSAPDQQHWFVRGLVVLIHGGMVIGITAGIIATVLGFAGEAHWAIDLLNHMRMHIMCSMLPAIAWMIWQGSRFWFLISFACFVVNCSVVRPWEMLPLPGPSISNAHQQITIASWNTLCLHRHPERIAECVESLDADIIVLIEYTDQLSKQLDSIRQSHQHAFESPSQGAFGIAVFSRLPVEFTSYRLGSGNIPVIESRVATRYGEFQLWSAHVFPPVNRMWHEREKQLHELTALVLANPHPVTALCGDLNDTPWSRNFRELQSRTSLLDSRSGQGYQATWPTKLGALGIPIDHVLHSAPVHVVKREAMFLDASSDHAAVRTTLAIMNPSE